MSDAHENPQLLALFFFFSCFLPLLLVALSGRSSGPTTSPWQQQPSFRVLGRGVRAGGTFLTSGPEKTPLRRAGAFQ